MNQKSLKCRENKKIFQSRLKLLKDSIKVDISVEFDEIGSILRDTQKPHVISQNGRSVEPKKSDFKQPRTNNANKQSTRSYRISS